VQIERLGDMLVQARQAHIDSRSGPMSSSPVSRRREAAGDEDRLRRGPSDPGDASQCRRLLRDVRSHRGALVERLPEGRSSCCRSRSKPLTACPKISVSQRTRVARKRIPAARYWPSLIAGSSRSVLQQGDAGHCHLPRSPGRTLAGVLQSHARDRVHADHGRIDIHSQPSAIYLTIVRVGVMLKFRLSIGRRAPRAGDCWTLATEARYR